MKRSAEIPWPQAFSARYLHCPTLPPHKLLQSRRSLSRRTIETRIGTLEFKDGAPSAETAEKVYDTLDFIRGVDAFLNSFSGASAYAIRKGF